MNKKLRQATTVANKTCLGRKRRARPSAVIEPRLWAANFIWLFSEIIISVYRLIVPNIMYAKCVSACVCIVTV